MNNAIATIAGLWLAMSATLGLGQEDRSAENLLDALVPDEKTLARLGALVEQLAADEFPVRQAALQKLLATPMLPAAVIRRGLASDDPEVVSQIQKIIQKGGQNRSAAMFDKALHRVEEDHHKGLLGKIVRVLESGVPVDDAALAERAAGATATEEDLDVIRQLAAGEEGVLRRMAAAGGEALGENGIPLLSPLLEDDERSVRMRAAISLGNLGEPAGARTLGTFLASEDAVERVRAIQALRGMTGKKFGYAALEPKEKREDSSKKWAAWLASDDLKLTGRAGEVTWLRLFNGRDLTGWTAFRAGAAVAPERNEWTVEKGVLVCPGNGPGDLRTNATFDNYLLTANFRAPERSADSGIGVMLTPGKEKPAAIRFDGGEYLEVQLLPKRSGDLYTIGGFKAQAAGENISFSHRRQAEVNDDFGKWHEMRLEVKGGTIKVFVNGTLVNEATGGPKEPGKILLREERYRHEFKDISLLPLGP